MVKCPFCNWEGKEFLPKKERINAKCPKCSSLERQRLSFFHLKDMLPKDKPIKLLHFAPEECLTEFFQIYPNIKYLSVDIESEYAMQKEDIINLSFNDNSFDIVVSKIKHTNTPTPNGVGVFFLLSQHFFK